MTLTDDSGVRHLRSSARWSLTRMTLCEDTDAQYVLYFKIDDPVGDDQAPTCLWCAARRP